METAKIEEAFYNMFWNQMDNVHTFFPATVTRIRNNGLIDVQPSVKIRPQTSDVDVLLPEIPNVLLMDLRSEKAILRFPKESILGSKVGIFCAEHSLLDWRINKTEPVLPEYSDRFNFNDAVAVLGLYPETLPWPVEQKPNTLEIQVSEGQKIGIGNTEGDEIVDLMYQLTEILLLTDSGSYDYTGKVSTKGKSISELNAILAKLGNVT